MNDSTSYVTDLDAQRDKFHHLSIAEMLQGLLKRVVAAKTPWCRGTYPEGRTLAFVGTFQTQSGYDRACALLTSALDIDAQEAMAEACVTTDTVVSIN